MTPEDRAADFVSSILIADQLRPRAVQATQGIIGGSNIGNCAEELRRLITQAPRTDAPASFAAMLGTWIHEGVWQAREATRPGLLHEQRLTVTLPNGAEVPLTVDEIDPEEPSCGDLKTKAGLADIRRGHSTRQQRWQRHLSGLAAIQAGLVPEQGLLVWNLWVDRSGKDRTVFVEQEPFSREVIAEISAYLDDVLDAVKTGQEAQKEQPRHWCQQWCAFYTDCRGPEIESGPITNPRLIAAVDEYAAASERKREAEAVMAALREQVENVTGRTELSEITSTQVNKGAGYVAVTARRIA